MNPNSIVPVQQFISANQLKRVEGNILFKASVSFYIAGKLQQLQSEVQLIILPNEMAVYILELLKETYHLTEMYSTSHYVFSYSSSNTLEIRNHETDAEFVIAIIPI